MAPKSYIEEAMNMLYEKTGSYLLTDLLTFYVITPLSIFGFFLNIISFKILINKELKARLFKYFRFYCANSIIVTFVLIFAVISARRFISISISNNYYSMFYLSYILKNCIRTGYFISSITQCFIIQDRISIYLPKLRMKTNVYLICLIITLFCVVLNMPFIFDFQPSELNFEINNQTTIKLHYNGASPLSKTTLGSILRLCIIVIRDIGTLLVEIFLNIVSIYLLIKYKKKKQMMGTILYNRANNQLSNTLLKLYIMVIMMSIISILEHLFVILATLGQINSSSLANTLSAFLELLAILIKHGSNIFFFCFFNKKFRKLF